MQWLAVHRTTWNCEADKWDPSLGSEDDPNLFDDTDFERCVFEINEFSGWEEDHYEVEGGVRTYSKKLNDVLRLALDKDPWGRATVERLKEFLDGVAKDRVRELYVPLPEWAIPSDPVDGAFVPDAPREGANYW